MDKTAIKNFSIWARNKLIADITYKAGLLGVTEEGIKDALSQSTQDAEFYDIGTKEPYAIHGEEIKQRKELVAAIKRKATQLNYKDAYRNVVEEVAYTWFNRLIAIRFMEVNDYMPAHIRVLSSDSKNKLEPDLVTTPFDAELEFTQAETEKIMQMKNDNQVDALFRFLFIKQCNALNAYLPKLFEKTSDYTELLLNVSVTDQDGIVYHLTHDINEADFNIAEGGQVEVIGWLYQYYNTEQNELVYDGSYAREKISKELVPAATTIYTPDWAVRYMVENSVGRIWLDAYPESAVKSNWKYLLDSNEICKKREQIGIEKIKCIDPCMGSGHILVYVFEVLLQIYESQGYSQRDAVQSILENNLYGLDIDDRAFQMAYFAVMMKARQYDRRILSRGIKTNLFSIRESNEVNRNQISLFGKSLESDVRANAEKELYELLDAFIDAKEYGSILAVKNFDWDNLIKFANDLILDGQIGIEAIGVEETQSQICMLIDIAMIMADKYSVVITNPPYLGSSRFDNKLSEYVKKNYVNEKADLSMVMYKRALTGFSQENGYVSFITTSSWMSLSSFEKMRQFVFENYCISSLVDFGTELFEGKVGHNPIVAWVTYNKKVADDFLAVKLVDFCYARRDEKEPEFFNDDNRYISNQKNFGIIPGVPVAYDASKAFMNNFKKGISVDKISEFTGSQHKTAGNEKYVRYWYEIDKTKHGKKWVPYIKGGEFRRWYGNLDLVVDWSEEALSFYKNNSTSNLLAEKYRFKEGVTYTSLSSAANGFRYLPPIGIFDIKGPSIVDITDMYYVLALFNTKVATKYFKAFNSTITLQVKDVKAFPIIIDDGIKENVETVCKETVMLSKEDWDSFESSWDFEIHPIVRLGRNKSVKQGYELWEKEASERFDKVKKNEEYLNKVFIELYEFTDEITPFIDDKDITVRKADLDKDIRSLIHYAIGCIFGRYSLDSNALICGGKDFDLNEYVSFKPVNTNIIPITDEEYLSEDIVNKFCEWLSVVFGSERLEENLEFIANALGAEGKVAKEAIRNYLIEDFYADHCSMCTVGVGGKRPYYWLFESGKQNGFKALVYMHRYNADTIGNLRVDYLHRMERIYESEINRMQDTIDNSSNAREVTAATKRKEKMQKQLKECQEYDEKIGHLALSRIEIDLDDGVKVNYEKVQTANDGKKYQVLAKI